jgi:hypothetical protein
VKPTATTSLSYLFSLPWSPLCARSSVSSWAPCPVPYQPQAARFTGESLIPDDIQHSAAARFSSRVLLQDHIPVPERAVSTYESRKILSYIIIISSLLSRRYVLWMFTPPLFQKKMFTPSVSCSGLKLELYIFFFDGVSMVFMQLFCRSSQEPRCRFCLFIYFFAKLLHSTFSSYFRQIGLNG